ncbi:hypothetical protein JCM3770_004888 [Rhodotorula araucariae]
MPPAMLAATPIDRSEPKCMVKPSKEWVVPPRPKPGRKSTKKDDPPAKSVGRTSQKAFRERRQEYVTELEEKVRQLEAGEGDKCVFYQQQAQKAKTETVVLQQENDALKKEIDLLRRELERVQGGAANSAVRASGGKDKGKGRAAPPEFEDVASVGPSKRPRRSAAVRAQAVVASATGSSPIMYYALAATSPLPALSPAGTSSSSSHSAYVHSPLNDFHPDGPASPGHPQLVPSEHALPSQHERCTFCPADDSCFCAQVGYEFAPPSMPEQTNALLAAVSSPAAQIKLEDTDDLFFTETGYEPAVPLRLRNSGSKAASVWAIEQPRADKAPIWAIEQPSAQAQRAVYAGAEAVCSGDPSNCPACSDDPFGKAFCNALSSTVCTTQPCSSCPGHATSRKMPTPPPDAVDEETALFESLTDLPCCGDPAACGSLTCKPSATGDSKGTAVQQTPPRATVPLAPDVETVPCNEAWTALKQHPNIAFADLQMLADVVAKRTYCGGPVCSTPPPPPGVTSETFVGRPELVPQAALQCSIDAGARKRLTVERGAVNEALDLLDRAVARGGPLRH